MTNIKVAIPAGARSGAIRKAYLKTDVDAEWAKSAYAKRIATRVAKRNMTDFDRFKSKVSKQAVSLQ